MSRMISTAHGPQQHWIKKKKHTWRGLCVCGAYIRYRTHTHTAHMEKTKFFCGVRRPVVRALILYMPYIKISIAANTKKKLNLNTCTSLLMATKCIIYIYTKWKGLLHGWCWRNVFFLYCTHARDYIPRAGWNVFFFST